MSIDRLLILEKELSQQHVGEYKVWHGVNTHPLPPTNIARAHKQIVKHALINNLPLVIIAEDDVHFTAPGAYTYFLKTIPAEFDIYLGGIIWGKTAADNSLLDFSGLQLYIVHLRFYHSFLDINEQKDLDRELAKTAKCVLCSPMVAIQHNGYSDNQKRVCDFDRYTTHFNLYGQ